MYFLSVPVRKHGRTRGIQICASLHKSKPDVFVISIRNVTVCSQCTDLTVV